MCAFHFDPPPPPPPPPPRMYSFNRINTNKTHKNINWYFFLWDKQRKLWFCYILKILYITRNNWSINLDYSIIHNKILFFYLYMKKFFYWLTLIIKRNIPSYFLNVWRFSKLKFFKWFIQAIIILNYIKLIYFYNRKFLELKPSY
jgi:hypothetical protein